MKKIIILIVGLGLSTTCFAQYAISVNNIISTELPKGTEAISKEKALIYASNKFKDSKIASIYISGTKATQIYQVEGVIIYIVTDDHKVKEGHLDEIKKGLDEFFKEDLSYKSSLSNINGNRFLITNSISQGVGVYSFFGNNTDNSQSATGSLIYSPADSGKASNDLDHILQNLKFKVQ